MDNKKLRYTVNLLVIQSGYKKTGWQGRLAKRLKISDGEMSKALTGRRRTKRYNEILTQAKKILSRML